MEALGGLDTIMTSDLQKQLEAALTELSSLKEQLARVERERNGERHEKERYRAERNEYRAQTDALLAAPLRARAERAEARAVELEKDNAQLHRLMAGKVTAHRSALVDELRAHRQLNAAEAALEEAKREKMVLEQRNAYCERALATHIAERDAALSACKQAAEVLERGHDPDCVGGGCSCGYPERRRAALASLKAVLK